MFHQIDGVGMGSSLGPVLANVFMGYRESLIPLEHWPKPVLPLHGCHMLFAL